MTPALDEAEEQRLLDLDFEAFDQQDEGWRQHAKAERYSEVAAVIDRYKAANVTALSDAQTMLLTWHSGQMQAIAGNYPEARSRFEQCFMPGAEQASWNCYVKATLAFLDGNADDLTNNRNALIQITPPQREPMNIHVIDGFIRKFGKPYKIAYDPKF